MATIIKVSSSQERTIQAREGDNFSLIMSVKNADNTDFNFTGYTAKMHVKERPVETDTPLIEMDITLSLGQIQITKPAADMLGNSGKRYYDLKLTDGTGKVTTWLHGIFELLPAVTV